MQEQTQKRIKIFVIAIACLVFIAGIFAVNGNRITYLEYRYANETCSGWLDVSTNNETITQEFVAPYNVIHGVSFRVGTYERDNNSIYVIRITDKQGQVLYAKEYGASLIDDTFYPFEFDKNIKLEKGEKYDLQIVAKEVTDATCIALGYSDVEENDPSMLINGVEQTGKALNLRIYGGDYDVWWFGFAVVLSVYLLIVSGRAIYLIYNNKKMKDDSLLTTLLVGGVTFLLIATFSVTSPFTDENDNIRGGMIIARGGVLYRDYVTQHTPVAYYLCALFALLGAGSVAQFRLSYYLFISIIWALVFCRHKKYYGAKKMIFLVMLEMMIVFSMVLPQGCQILSEGIQGICMVILLLEYIRYCDDGKLDWCRCTIISLCIWGSIGAVFINVYALIGLAVVVIIQEIIMWRENGISFKQVLERYFKLLVAILVPILAVVIYFGYNHALKTALRQAYSFNREVYSGYLDGFGENIAQPFINGFQNLFKIVSDNINSLINSNANNGMVVQLLIIIMAVTVMVLLLKRGQILQGIALLLTLCGLNARVTEFHGLATWYIAILIIVIYCDEIMKYVSRLGLPILVLLSLYIFSSYVNLVGNNILYKQSAVSEIESRIVELTDEGEEILIDAYSCDSIYLLYKNRYPANRAVYMLPWYMDWYEKEVIEDLETKKPRIVVYNEDATVWTYSHHANALCNKLKQDYLRFSDNPEDGWTYSVWLRK